MLKFNSAKLEHAGNYTCLAKNPAGQQTYSAQLIVRAEPRWSREPLNEPIVATRGQTIVIDCQTTGYPKPQQTWKIKSKYSLGSYSLSFFLSSIIIIIIIMGAARIR